MEIHKILNKKYGLFYILLIFVCQNHLFDFPAYSQQNKKKKTLPFGIIPAFNLINSKDKSEEMCLGGSLFLEIQNCSNSSAFVTSIDWSEEKWLGVMGNKNEEFLYSSVKLALGLGHSGYHSGNRRNLSGVYVGGGASINYIDEPLNPNDLLYGFGGWIDITLTENFAFAVNHDVLKSFRHEKQKYYLSKLSFIFWKWLSINIAFLRDANNEFKYYTVCPGIFIRDYSDVY
ncbi:hypothetical protein JXJ21_08995 [candidate division KSB1 bacterium]|nr:hypothetical protein [candidate division KSB1 bacterium]